MRQYQPVRMDFQVTEEEDVDIDDAVMVDPAAVRGILRPVRPSHRPFDALAGIEQLVGAEI